jgi:transcriptional antiterminator Rof (Rho-off)
MPCQSRRTDFGARRNWVYVFSVAAICQDIVGRCSFIDVLEEAVLVHRPVAVALRDGTRFIDVVVDVVTENGEDYAVFHNRERVPVTEIAATTRADPHLARRP